MSVAEQAPKVRTKLKNLHTLADLTEEDLEEILDLADNVMEKYYQGGGIPAWAPKRELVDLPEGTKPKPIKQTVDAGEATTRTGGTMVEGGNSLAIDSYVVSSNSSKNVKGEGHTHDRFQHVDIQKADIYAERTSAEGATKFDAEMVARYYKMMGLDHPLNVPIINLGDGAHGHPTQAVGDSRFIRRLLKKLKKSKKQLVLGLVGGVRLSRTASEILRLAKLWGFKVILFCQRSQMSMANLLEGVDWSWSGDWKGVEKCDVLYWIRPQFERAEIDPMAYKRAMAEFRFTPDVHKKCKPGVVHMHAQPIMDEDDLIPVFPGMYWNKELNLPTIQEQARLMVAARMALLYVVWVNRNEETIIPVPPKVTTRPLILMKNSDKREELGKKARKRKRAGESQFFTSIVFGIIIDHLLPEDAIILHQWLLRTGLTNLISGVNTPIVSLRTNKLAGGWKGVVVIENTLLTPEQMAAIQCLFPHAVFNLVNGRNFRKFRFPIHKLVGSRRRKKEGIISMTPDGLLPCPNKKCITNVCAQANLTGFNLRLDLLLLDLDADLFRFLEVPTIEADFSEYMKSTFMECRFCEHPSTPLEVYAEIATEIGPLKLPEFGIASDGASIGGGALSLVA